MIYQPRFTKTFVYHQWFRRPAGGDPSSWVEITEGSDRSKPIDQQVEEWLRESAAILLHPGQLSIHTSWHDKEMTLRCMSYGLTVLYMEQTYATRERPGTEDAAGQAGAGGPELTDAGRAVYDSTYAPIEHADPTGADPGGRTAAAGTFGIVGAAQGGAAGSPVATGTACGECGEPQFATTSGVTCPNGHGGADPVAVDEPTEPADDGRPPRGDAPIDL